MAAPQTVTHRIILWSSHTASKYIVRGSEKESSTLMFIGTHNSQDVTTKPQQEITGLNHTACVHHLKNDTVIGAATQTDEHWECATQHKPVAKGQMPPDFPNMRSWTRQLHGEKQGSPGARGRGGVEWVQCPLGWWKGSADREWWWLTRWVGNVFNAPECTLQNGWNVAFYVICNLQQWRKICKETSICFSVLMFY